MDVYGESPQLEYLGSRERIDEPASATMNRMCQFARVMNEAGFDRLEEVDEPFVPFPPNGEPSFVYRPFSPAASVVLKRRDEAFIEPETPFM